MEKKNFRLGACSECFYLRAELRLVPLWGSGCCCEAVGQLIGMAGAVGKAAAGRPAPASDPTDIDLDPANSIRPT